MAAAVASSSSAAGVDPLISESGEGLQSYSSNRKFAEIGLGDLAEVLGVARESLDPSSDRDTWSLILSALTSTASSRSSEQSALLSRLQTLSSQLSTLSSSNPRAAWRTPTVHSQTLAGYGQRTLELAKQIAKLETAISRGEVDVRECKEELGRLERGEVGEDPDALEGKEGEGEGQTVGEKELGRHTLALTMFRQLGFQPVQPGQPLAESTASNTSSSSSASASTISTLFARSDAKGKVTTFKVGPDGSENWEKMDESERARRCNEMWEAVE